MPDQDLNVSDSMKQIYKCSINYQIIKRIAFTLSKMDGFNNLEIAEIMNTTIIAVESLVYRAKRKLLLTYYTF
jgi:RNA polymerase sigma-70 factor (ECF subfamily)